MRKLSRLNGAERRYRWGRLSVGTLAVGGALLFVVPTVSREASAWRGDPGPGGRRGPPHQRGPHRGPPFEHLERLAEKLGVDAETRAKMTAFAKRARETSEALHRELREERRKLRSLLEQDMPESAAVMAQVDKVGGTRLRLKKLHLGTMLRMRALLTPEQRKALRKLRASWHADLKTACAEDAKTHCAEIEGRGLGWCLAKHRDELSSGCRDALGKHRPRGHHRRRGRRGGR